MHYYLFTAYSHGYHEQGMMGLQEDLEETVAWFTDNINTTTIGKELVKPKKVTKVEIVEVDKYCIPLSSDRPITILANDNRWDGK